MSTPTAAWPAPSLVGALCRAGWGDDLDGRAGGGVRQVLRALVDLLPHGSAAGKVTAAQVADAAGLSVRWTRNRLHVLEDLGLISWRRGGVVDGRPTAGWVRICKTALAALVRRTRGHLDTRRKARQAATRERFKGLRNTRRLFTNNRTPLSVHAELSASLPFQGGAASVPSSRISPQTPTGDPMATQLVTPCRICGKLPEHCEEANRRVAPAGRHPYEASPLRVVQIVAPPAARRTPPQAKAAPKGWRDRQPCTDVQPDLLGMNA